MLKSMIAGALAALALAGPALLGATAASAASPEANAVGTELARTIFRSMSFETLIAKEVTAGGNPFGEVKSRPEWTGFLVEALKEEITHDLPALERMFGEALAAEMSLAELRVGVVILSDPMMQAMMRAGSEGDESPEPKGEPSRETRRAISSRDGASFLRKLERLEQILAPLQDDFVADLLPGAFRRFADKVDAGEAARRSKAR